MKLNKERQRYLVDILELYRSEGNPWPPAMRDVVRWAMLQGILEEDPVAREKRLAEEMAAAAREEYFSVPGLPVKVRRYHCATLFQLDDNGKEVQVTKWDDIDTISHEMFAMSMNDRRRQINGDISRFDTDANYYNEHRLPPGARPIQPFLRYQEEDTSSADSA